MAMGKPIVTADSPAVRELFAPDSPPMVLVPPADAAALAATLRRLLHDPAQLRLLGEAAAQFFKAHLMPRTIVANLLRELPSSVSRGGHKSYTE